MIPEQIKPAANLLANYYRQPKVYVRLPSQGQFYPTGSLDVSQNAEYAVYAMTAKDELMFKTPDALMNGQATVEVIKSCVPSIANPWLMPSIDLDAVLVAIRIATYGETMEVHADCPSCSHYNDYEFKLTDYLDLLSTFQFEATIELAPLVVKIRPYNYQEITKTALKALEQQKIFDVVNNETMEDDEKLEKFNKSFMKLTQLTVDVIVGCIDVIQTPEGEVSDKNQIREFIDNAPREIFNAVNEHITKMKNALEMQAQHVECADCNHKFDMTITMDQSNFFAVRS